MTGQRFWTGSLVLAALTGMVLSAADGPAPKKWSLSLTLQTSGQYKVMSTEVNYTGDLSFTLAWEGTMEEDADDFRLIQRQVTLPQWQAYEISQGVSSDAILTTMDFPKKPSFQYFFVLKERSLLQIVFALEGFDIPVHSSGEKVYLDLPRSAGGTMPLSDIDYEAHIQKGSNVLRIPVELINNRPLQQTFAWSWGHQRWLAASDQIIFSVNNHQLTATVAIRPQAESR